MPRNAPIQQKEEGGRIDPRASRPEGDALDRHNGHGRPRSPANRHAKSNG